MCCLLEEEEEKRGLEDEEDRRIYLSAFAQSLVKEKLDETYVVEMSSSSASANSEGNKLAIASTNLNELKVYNIVNEEPSYPWTLFPLECLHTTGVFISSTISFTDEHYEPFSVNNRWRPTRLVKNIEVRVDYIF